MKKRIIILFLLLCCLVWAVRAAYGWLSIHPVAGSGGVWFPVKHELSVRSFLQGDSRWGEDFLGPTKDTLTQVGCAVTSAAMVLDFHGIKTDPGELNSFLTKLPGGYTPEGWIYWEKAAELSPEKSAGLLPHYEAGASHALIDMNLIRGNPVIARVRLKNGITHFVVIVGKDGWDYLILDPGSAGAKGVYPLKDLGVPVNALRFYGIPG
ncbi:MAG: C39 family peptidase [Chthoniobacterales bacterium]